MLENVSWTVTMFSFTNELVLGYQSPNQLLRSIADEHLANSVELDNFQHFATAPDISDEEVEEFRSLVDERGFNLVEMGIYLDAALHPGRLMDDSERIDYLARQIRSARRLGFSAVKMMFGVDFAILDGLVPVLEQERVVLNQEVQGATRPDSPELDRQRDYAATRGQGLLGFVFDSSACMAACPVTYLDELRRLGVPKDVVRILEEDWPSDRTSSTREAVEALTKDLDLPAQTKVRLGMPFMRFGNTPVEEFREFLHSCSVVQLKYWDLEDDANRVSGPMASVARELQRLDYAGPLTSEWGGHEWLSGPGFDAVSMTRGHRALFDTVAATSDPK
jgi:hypothetical protein